MTAAERAELAAYQTTWDPSFEGDSTLTRDGERVALSGPREPEAGIVDGQVVIRFLRAVETPFRPGADTIAMAYDPGYFTAYAITEAPRLEGAAEGCAVRLEPFEPDGMLAAMQARLLSLPADAEPEDPRIGALFADRIHVTCD
jgi:polyphosphate kinase